MAAVSLLRASMAADLLIERRGADLNTTIVAHIFP
jgi:hypothetical protein